MQTSRLLSIRTNWGFIPDGGEGEIRTHEGREALPVFKTGAFNRSATSPAAPYIARPDTLSNAFYALDAAQVAAQYFGHSDRTIGILVILEHRDQCAADGYA